MAIQHSLETELYNLQKTAPSMVFNPEKQSFDEWKTAAREKLSELLGLHKFQKCEENFEIESVEELPDHTKIRFCFDSEENCRVPCVLVVPKNKCCEKPPLMICLQGHGTGMHISLGEPKYDIDAAKIENGDRNFAVQCVAKGICALAIDQRCFGERGGNPRPNCHGAALVAMMTGRTVIGGRVWDVMRAIDVVEKHFADKCDTKKIYSMGNSGGGTATFYLSALEDRIKAAIPSCAFCTFYDSIGAKNHCECNYIPHIAEYFDMAEIAGMSAPKPMVVVSGLTDGIFPIDGAKAEFARLKEIYAALGKPENCAHVIGSEGHRFYAKDAWEVFDNMV